MKTASFLLLSLFFICTLTAQDEKTKSPTKIGLEDVSSHFYSSFGLGYHDFQDNKYSAVTYGGPRGLLAFGFEKIKPTGRWQLGIDLAGGLNSGNTNMASGFVVSPTIHFRNLRKLNDQFELGGRWDIFDGFLNKTEGLGNNSIYVLISSNIYASGAYNKSFSKGRKLTAGLDLGLLSFNRENTGFAFSAPQNLLEDGEFDYQNIAGVNPFYIKYFEFEPFWKFVNIRTSLAWKTTGRSSFIYEWSVKSIAETKGYRATIGTHIVKYRLNLNKKNK